LAVALGVVALVGSCSLDYNPARLEEEISAEVPSTVLLDFRHTIVSDGQVWVVLEARRAETYEKRKEIVLESVSFREYDSTGQLVTEALADRAVYHTDTEDASASGSIRIYSPDEKASVRAESLVWTREGKRLEADPQAAVRLEKEDGSYVEGRGFRADFRRRRLEFDGTVEGRYVWEEDE
jgi:LPS export ABC transporter protein LptC